MATKKCPYCAEEIQEAAILCKHCRSNLDSLPPIQTEIKEEAKVQTAISEAKDVNPVENALVDSKVEYSSSTAKDKKQDKSDATNSDLTTSQKVSTNSNSKIDTWKTIFKNWNVGGKLIFISTFVAVISLFLTWVDTGLVSASGFQQMGYLFLAFFIYPVYKLFKNKPMNKIIALILCLLSMLTSIFYFISKNVELFGETINLAGTGFHIFALTTVTLTVGVFKHNNYILFSKNSLKKINWKIWIPLALLASSFN